MPSPQPLQHHDCWKTHFKRNSYHSPIWKGQHTTSHMWKTHGYHKVPVLHKTMCILAWYEWCMNNIPMSQTTRTKTTTQPTPAPECPWQHIGAGFEYLAIVNHYTKMPFVRRMLSFQYNATKTILVLKGYSLSMVSRIHQKTIICNLLVTFSQNPRSNG